METDAQPAADPPKDRKTYNGIQHFPNMQMGLAHYRTLDAGERGCSSHVVTRAREKRSGRPAMLREQHEEHQRSHHTFRRKGWCGKGRWLQAKARLGAEATLARLGPRTAMSGCGIDPKSEKFYALTPYNSMGGNPVSMVDPDGDEIFTAMLIGAAIGALTHTGGHLATNNFTFNNWNWASFAGSVVAGGVGGGVSSAVTSAGIGGFSGGAITGGASGFAQNLTTGLLDKNQTITGKGLLESTLLGAGIGGTIQGLGAAIDGRNFWDGTRTDYFLIAEDDGLNHIMQEGRKNCGPACGEMAIDAQGGNIKQERIRDLVGGDPNLDGVSDFKVMNTIKDEFGYNFNWVNEGRMLNHSSKSDYIISSLKNGRSVNPSWPKNRLDRQISAKIQATTPIKRLNLGDF